MNSKLRKVSVYFVALFFVVAGVNHFVMPQVYLAIMPKYLPFHHSLVFLSGVLEVLLGLFVLLPKARTLAGWGLVLFLVAVFPANIHAALYPETFPYLSSQMLWMRLPLQILLIWWVIWSTR